MNADGEPIARRTVLRAVMTGLGLALPGLRALAAEPAPFFKRHHLPIGLQLATVGAEARKDLHGTLARVAAAGYQSVELAGLYGNSPQAMRKAADAVGLKFTSIHLPPKSANGEPGFDQPPEVLGFAMQELGVEDVVLPMFLQNGAQITADDWKVTADFLNTTAVAMQRVALRLSYHNHSLELRPIGDTCGLEILLANTNPKGVHFEMDVGAVAAGGADPIKLLQQHPGRFRMMHVDPADVGTGMPSWVKILDVAYATGVRKFFVEQEPPFKGDPLDSIASSARSLATIA